MLGYEKVVPFVVTGGYEKVVWLGAEAQFAGPGLHSTDGSNLLAHRSIQSTLRGIRKEV